jgi:hypothetical protein
MTDGKITCPRALDLTVVDNAKKKYEEFRRTRNSGTNG